MNDVSRLFEALTLKLIKKRVRRLVGKHGISTSDQEDLEQDLYLHLLERLRRFDENLQNIQAYLGKILDHRVVTILRKRTAEKRDHRRHRSLSESARDIDGQTVELAALIPDDHVTDRDGLAREGSLARKEREIDVNAVMALLPENLRVLADRLKWDTPSEVARQTGVPRTTVNDAIRRIRKHFEEHGIEQKS